MNALLVPALSSRFSVLRNRRRSAENRARGSSDFFAPVFKCLLYDQHKLVGDSAIDDAMVVAECEMNDGADSDGIRAVFVGDDHGLLGNAADAHDGYVRLVDDGQAEDCAELARIGDGEGRAFDIGRHELFGARTLAESAKAMPALTCLW